MDHSSIIDCIFKAFDKTFVRKAILTEGGYALTKLC